MTRSLARHDPNVNHSVSFLMPTRSPQGGQIFDAFASQEGFAIKRQRQKRSSRRHFASLTWKSPWRAPRFRPDFFNFPTARVRAHKARPEPSSQPANIRAVGASRVEIDLPQDQNVSIYADQEVCLAGRWFSYGYMERAGSQRETPGRSIRLPPRPGRESHRGIVIDPAQSELADGPVQKKVD